MNDKQFLIWIYERLISKHHEKDTYDYMIRLKKIIDKVST